MGDARTDSGRARRRRSPGRRRDVAGAIGLVLAGIALIAWIVTVSPAWQRVFAAWRERASAGSDVARGEPVAPAPVGVISSGIVPRLAPGPGSSQPVPVRPARSTQSTSPAARSAARSQSDTTQVMAGLLVSQLGQDPAWRTALANAEAHAVDSPEHAYWRAVAAAIRDGSHRARP
jgi:hypothetical protein